MKITNLFLAGFCTLAILISCDKKEDSGPEDPFEAEYSEKSVEENKANLEKTGQDMVSEMDELKDADAIAVLMNFSTMAESMGEEEEVVMGIAGMITDISNENYSAEKTLSTLKSVTEEPNSITDLWDEIVGRYTWNFTSEDWDITELENAVIIEFPGLEDDITNTATITIDNFTTQTLVDPVIEFEEDIEPIVPTSLNADLKYNGNTIATYMMTASYLDNGMPTGLNTKLTLAGFSYQVDMTHTPYTEMSLTSSFRHNDRILIEGHIDNSGNWTEENIDKVTEEETESEIPPVEEILANSNAYIQVMNIKVAGSVNVDGLAKDLRVIEDEYENIEDPETLQGFNESLAAAMNENAQLVIVYADNNEKIAEVEAYTYYDEYWDEYYVDLRFIFADESASDAETYFGEGFSDLIDDINDFIEELNEEYDLEIEPIEE